MSLSINDWLKAAEQTLTTAGIETARLDALVLLEDCLGVDRAQLLAHPEQELSSDQEKVLSGQIARRVEHEPLAYIRGKAEFYGREFIVGSAVLVPRPETETMIELLMKHEDLPSQPVIADVGTGSGAIGITVQLEMPGAIVELLEIDESAMEIARQNVAKYGLKTPVIQSDLLAGGSRYHDVLLCNLPYVPELFKINRAAKHEPALALFGGMDGLYLYRNLFKQLQLSRNQPSMILTESLPRQHAALTAIAEKYGYEQVAREDFIQLFTPVPDEE
jgi:release factor glutamine methyltransferase